MMESLEILHKRETCYKKFLSKTTKNINIPNGNDLSDPNHADNEIIVRDTFSFEDYNQITVLKETVERLQSLDDILVPLPLDNTPIGISFNTNVLNESQDGQYNNSNYNGSIYIQYAYPSAIGVPRLKNHALELIARNGMELGTNVANIS